MRPPPAVYVKVDVKQRGPGVSAETTGSSHIGLDYGRASVGADLHGDDLVHEGSVLPLHVSLDECPLVSDGPARLSGSRRVVGKVEEPRPADRERPVEADEAAHHAPKLKSGKFRPDPVGCGTEVTVTLVINERGAQ